MYFFDSPIFMILALITSIVFSTVAGVIPPGGGNLIAAVFMASMGAYVGGEEDESVYDREIADDDI